VLAVNNYRQSGGGNFPHVSTGPSSTTAGRDPQLLIDWVVANEVIDPTKFASVDWRLVSGGAPITII
jgi:2',3'-cyclic-nucleotide 2'-phosphodiesterase/3'-nucleotidase